MSKKGKKSRRISGLGGLDIQSVAIDVLGTAGGAMLPEIIITKAVPNMSPKITGFGQVVIGAAVRAYAGNEPLWQAMGGGMIAGGALRLGREFMPDLFGGAPAVQGIGEADFRETALTVDTDYDDGPVSGTDRESATPSEHEQITKS